MAATKILRYHHDNEIIEHAAKLIEQRYLRERRVIYGPDSSTDLLRAKLAGLDHEVFAVLFLDTAHAVIAFEKMFRGTLKATRIYPREIARAALKHNAAAVVLAHNHPSGNAEPSSQDWQVTSEITQALMLIDVEVLDHIIIAGTRSTSLVDRGGMTYSKPKRRRHKKATKKAA